MVFLNRLLWFLSLSVLSHTLDHLGLDRAVSVVLAVEVLRFVAHAVASVADNWDLDLGLVWHLSLFTVLIGVHRDLEASRECLIVLSSAHITILQARTHRVNIKEWILAMLNVCHGFPVQGLVALVAHSWQIQIGASLSCLNTLEPITH